MLNFDLNISFSSFCVSILPLLYLGFHLLSALFSWLSGSGHWLHLHCGTLVCLLKISLFSTDHHVDLILFFSVRWHPSCFMSCLVWKTCSCDDRAIHWAEITLSFTIIINATQSMSPHCPLHVFVVVTIFCVQVSYNNNYVMSVACIGAVIMWLLAVHSVRLFCVSWLIIIATPLWCLRSFPAYIIV